MDCLTTRVWVLYDSVDGCARGGGVGEEKEGGRAWSNVEGVVVDGSVSISRGFRDRKRKRELKGEGVWARESQAGGESP